MLRGSWRAGSGLSEGEFVSLGHLRSYDAEAVLHEPRSGGRSNGKVALWGRSMGAATALIGVADVRGATPSCRASR